MSDKAHIIYTYENVAVSTEFTIGHFIVSEHLSRNIIDYRSLCDGKSLSDHVPILLTLSLAAEHDENNDSRQYVKRVQWDKATADNIAHFKNMLDEFCARLNLPFDALYCQDTSCWMHSNAMNVYFNNIIDICLLASDMCIPRTKKRGYCWLE